MKFLSIICVIFLFTYCTKGGESEGVTGSVYAVNATASSKQLVPAIDTTSTATLAGVYDASSNTLTYTIAWTDLWRDTKKDTITSISFYGPATVTENGPLLRTLPFVNTNRNGSINLGLAGNTGITTDEKNAFMTGSWYFTINSKRYGAGIVRGQLVLTEK
jgi:CHRD domain-containing protein